VNLLPTVKNLLKQTIKKANRCTMNLLRQTTPEVNPRFPAIARFSSSQAHARCHNVAKHVTYAALLDICEHSQLHDNKINRSVDRIFAKFGNAESSEGALKA
jgi:hypothetical protein